MQQFEGKTVVVTGGGSGIGRGLALGFADEGMRVAVLDLNTEGRSLSPTKSSRAAGKRAESVST